MGLFEPHGRHRGCHGQIALIVAGFRTLDDMPDLAGKRVLVRVDLNVPMSDGYVSDATRLSAAVPTIATLADRGVKEAEAAGAKAKILGWGGKIKKDA